jgi:hypothetical protein
MSWRLAILLTGVALAVGVGALSAGATSRVHAPTPLVGKWTKTMSTGDWQKHHITYEPAGKFVIAISKTGVISIYGPAPYGFITTTRMLTIGPGSITLSPTADHFCGGKAIFTWAASSKRLTFRAIKDVCDARRTLFTTGPWSRVK